MKTIILLAAIVIPFITMAQQIDIENIDLSDNQKYSVNSITVTDKFKDIESAGKTISFDGDGSFIEFKGIENTKRLQLSYLSSINGELLVIISYKKFGETNYSTLVGGTINNLNKNTLALNRFLPVFIPISFYGKYDYKISLFLPQQGNGIFTIDNITFEKFSPKEIDNYNQGLEMERRIQTGSDKIYSENRRIDYNRKVSNLKTDYIKRIEIVRELSYRTNVLASISKSITLINDRAKMNDPNQYKIFAEKILFIKEHSDDIQKTYIDTLINQIKYKPIPPLSANADRKQGILKVVQVAGDIGNIITGGQFKSVVNSIQGIVSTIFSKASVQNKVIEFTANGSNLKPKFADNKTIADITSVVQKGRETQAFLFEFFIRLEEEQRQFKGIIDDFREYSFEADNLIDAINQNQTDFYKFTNQPLTKENLSIYYRRKGSPDVDVLLAGLQTNATNYFNGLELQKVDKGPLEYNSKESELNYIIGLSIKMDELGKRYDAMASNLKTLFGKIEADLNKPNPFGKKDNGNWVKNSAYGSSWDEYEVARTTAKTSFTSLKDNLEVVLSSKSVDTQ